jgi:hypothetical protein
VLTVYARIAARPSEVKKALDLLEKDAKAKEEFATAFLRYPLGRRIVSRAMMIIERNARDLLSDVGFDTARVVLGSLVPQSGGPVFVDPQKAAELQAAILTHSPKILESLQTWSKTRLDSRVQYVCSLSLPATICTRPLAQTNT